MQVCGVRLRGAGSPVSIKKKRCKTTDLILLEDACRKETSKATTDVRRHDNFRTSNPKPLSDDVERLRSRKAKRDDSPITKNDHIDDIPDSKKSQVCALGIVGSSFPNTHMRSRTLNGPGETSRKVAMRMRLSTWLQILLRVCRRTRKMVQGLAFCSIQNTSSWAARWSWTAYVDVALLKKFPVAWKVYACRRA